MSVAEGKGEGHRCQPLETIISNSIRQLYWAKVVRDSEPRKKIDLSLNGCHT